MIKNLIRFFGLKGSWKWACRQMDKGSIIYRTTDSGNAKYRLDTKEQRRICWHYTDNPNKNDIWPNASVFLSDFDCVTWAIWK